MLGMLKDDLQRTALMIGWPATLYGFVRTLIVNAAGLAVGVVLLVFWNSVNPLGRAVGIGIVFIQVVRLVFFMRELRIDAASN